MADGTASATDSKLQSGRVEIFPHRRSTVAGSRNSQPWCAQISIGTPIAAES